jgi:hypothetical protein
VGHRIEIDAEQATVVAEVWVPFEEDVAVGWG